MKRALWGLLAAAALIVSGCVGADAGPSQGPEVTLEAPTGDEAAIAGHVTDDQFQPLADVEIAIVDVAPVLTARSDADGQFVINNVPPGPHKIIAQKLGYESAARNVELVAGETLDFKLALAALPVRDVARHQTLIGQGYFACGAYLVVTSWGNLHACVWDEHKPRYEFEAAKTDLVAILQEVVWRQSTALTAEQLETYLQYKPVCDPFCQAEKEFSHAEGKSPIRNYVDFEKEAKKFQEDPIPLASMTFPAGDDTPVIVFQQRMTHYITMFWGDHCVLGSEGDECPPEIFTAVPDN